MKPVFAEGTEHLIDYSLVLLTNQVSFLLLLLSTQFCQVTHVEIQEGCRMESSRGQRSVLATKCVTAVTRASFWRVMHCSLVTPVQKTLPPGTSLCPSVEVSVLPFHLFWGRDGVLNSVLHISTSGFFFSFMKIGQHVCLKCS